MDEQPDQSAPVDLDGVLERLRLRVEERRAAGAYPPGLEEEMEGHLRRIAAHRLASREPAVPSLVEQLSQAVRIPAMDPGRLAAATRSAVPGGGALHAAVAKLVSHQTAGVLAQVQDLANGVWEALVVLAGRVDELVATTAADPATHAHAELVALVDLVVDRIALYERQPASSPAGVAELGRRLERLEAAEAARSPRSWPFPDPEADRLDGAPTPAEEDVALLVAHLEGCAPVLQLGPVPGRLLGALARAGIEASGVDHDEGRCQQALSAGVSARRGDPLVALGAEPDGALGGLVVAGLLERLGLQQVLDLVGGASDKLRPGGRAVLWGANPRCLWGLAHGWGSRPDRTLVDPGWLAACCRQAGFGAVEVQWGAPAPGGGDAPSGLDGEAAVRRVVSGPASYVVVARR